MNQKRKTEPELSIQSLEMIRRLFQSKGWPFEGDFGEQYFNDYSQLLSRLNKEQQDTILALTEEFLWIPDSQYIRLVQNIFSKFIESLSEAEKNIIIAPLLPERDFGKAKSSVALLYLIKCHIPSLQNRYPNHHIVVFDYPPNVIASPIIETSVLCLVDDFIGSGETALSAIQYYEEAGVSSACISVLSLVAMEQGIAAIEKNNHKVLAEIIRNKAISDRTDGNRDEYARIMSSIEDHIKVHDEFRFGYAHSEALVKMARTPNNTFPIYWLRGKKNPTPPFPR